MLVCYHLAARVDVELDGSAVVTYVERLPKEFSVSFAKAACRRDTDLLEYAGHNEMVHRQSLADDRDKGPVMKSLHPAPNLYFRGSNFMTPEVVRYGFTQFYAYELSTGRGIDRQPIFGVTVCNRETGENSPLSKVLQSRTDAERYVTMCLD